MRILDVRTSAERRAFSLPTSIHIPVDELPQRYHELDQLQRYVCVCAHGIRSEYAADFLVAHGWNTSFNLIGGFVALAPFMKSGGVMIQE